jgi:hypothetical protein
MPPLYRRLIQNYDDLRLTTAEQEPPGTKCLVFCDTAYYNDNYKNPALAGLLDTMTLLGDSTEVISYPDPVGPQGYGAIKQEIHNRYFGQDSALHWVLLVGDHDQIPQKLVSTNQGQAYSDYWYSDLTLGYPDSCDSYPEIGIARLSPDKSGANGGNDDLSRQIAKIRAYMMGTHAGDWVNKMTLVAHKDPSPDSAVAGADTIPLQFYAGTRDTIRGHNSAVWNSTVANAVNQGTGVLIYLGHGEYDRWGLQRQQEPYAYWNTNGEYWTEDEVGDLDSQDCTPVVFNLACQCGDLSQGTCLSEQWMRKYPGGAVASFGSTCTIDPPPANSQCSIAVRATRDYWSVPQHEEYYAPAFDLGGIQMLMDAYIAKTYPNTLSNIYSFMWLGNPAMPVWSGGIPETATVNYPSQIPTGPQSFHVSVKTSSGRPFENARVCAYKPGDFYAVGLTNGNGDVWLSLTASSEDSFYVSASEGHVLLSSRGQQHTPMLPYFGKSVVSGDTAFATPDMTYPNWGRKLVRGPGTNTLHVVYTDRDSVFYTQSTDGGTTWPIIEPVAAGKYPSIVLNGEVLAPWVVYVTYDGSIKRAIRSAGPPVSWSRATIFQSSDTNGRAGAPSLAVGALTYTGYATYPVSVRPADNYVLFSAFSSATVSLPETLDAAGPTSCYGASVAVSPGSYVHVAWIRGQSVIYRQRSISGWSAQVPVSDTVWPPTEPASNPSVEAYGDYVYCVWRGPHDSTNLTGEIWRRSRWLNYPTWEDPSNQSKSDSLESDYPVMTTNFVTVWHEQVSQDSTEIWGRFLPDLEPRRLFPSHPPSWYPHVDGYWPTPEPVATFRCYAVWTEQQATNPPSYVVESGVYNWVQSPGKGIDPSPHDDYEPALYYAAALGQPEQSPYCLSRGGYAKFEDWDVDTSATTLKYQMPYVNPHRAYKLCAIIYHEGKVSWSANIRCDSGSWTRVQTEPGVPETLWLKVPKKTYKNDAQIVLELARVKGDYVSLAKLKLFQVEEQPGDDWGVQSVDFGRAFVTRLGACSPNPFARGTSVNYELADYGTVELTVHDVSGRLVQRLGIGPRQRGFHTVRWDGTDAHGRTVPAGVYFVRLSAGGVASTGCLTLVR